MKIARYPTHQAEDRVIYLVFLEREKEKKHKEKNKKKRRGELNSSRKLNPM